MGLGNEEPTLKTSRAYMAGLGTTGVLIGSFLLLLTVGSTLVAFRGVPGQASNGDLSRIELRQQREAAAQNGPALLAASNVLGEAAQRSGDAGASGDVFGQSAGGGHAGQIHEGAAANGPDGLRQIRAGAPPAGKAPGTPGPSPAPGSGTGIVETPAAPGSADDGSSSGSGSGTDTGSGSDSGSSGGSGSSGSGTGTTDSGSGSDSGSATGGTTGTVGGTVEDTTGTVGTVVGTVTPGAGDTVTDTGAAVGGLLDDATSAVDGLTGGLGGPASPAP